MDDNKEKEEVTLVTDIDRSSPLKDSMISDSPFGEVKKPTKIERKEKNKDYEIEIQNVEFCENVMIVEWAANIGFGQYVIQRRSDGRLYADTEYMDIQDDKAFSEQLFKELVKCLIIEG